MVQKLKGQTFHKLLHSFESLRSQYWGHHLWARGYFCCSNGNVTDEVIKAYIEQQSRVDNDFKFEGEA